MPEVRPYYSDKGLAATFYDLTTEADSSLAGDIDLYAAMAPGGSVLELGSGTGRVSLALAERGMRVLGVDLADRGRQPMWQIEVRRHHVVDT